MQAVVIISKILIIDNGTKKNEKDEYFENKVKTSWPFFRKTGFMNEILDLESCNNFFNKQVYFNMKL